MTREPDDDALSWGDDDPSHVSGPAQRAVAATARDEHPSGSGPVALVAYGVIAGIFLLYSIGWFIAVQRDDFTQPGPFAETMYQLGEFLAIASPPIWMVAVFAFVARPAARLVWLGVGILLLVPWPFVTGA